MSHLLVGWSLANTMTLDRRDRALVTIAGVLPDIDGLGLLGDLVRDGGDGGPSWYWTFHHNIAHNLATAAMVCVVVFAIAHRRVATTALAFTAFHLHLLADIAGSRGPDGYQWPIPYLRPFSDAWTLTWSGQWELNAWPNLAITALLLGFTFHVASSRGRSPLEIVSLRADRAFVRALRNRFGTATSDADEGNGR